MSGSGPAVFGLTETLEEARRIADQMADRYSPAAASSL